MRYKIFRQQGDTEPVVLVALSQRLPEAITLLANRMASELTHRQDCEAIYILYDDKSMMGHVHFHSSPNIDCSIGGSIEFMAVVAAMLGQAPILYTDVSTQENQE